MAITRRNADALVALALTVENKANLLRCRDPVLFQKAHINRLHEAAKILGDCGRELRALLNQ